ncbi:hypothetical protein JTB14_037152 [Gonioctena quinquepunctata]|nr:hypothetical protein JTB14_037152 [Gonioctena quinquepunctata]
MGVGPVAARSKIGPVAAEESTCLNQTICGRSLGRLRVQITNTFLMTEDGVGKNKIKICTTKSGIEAMRNGKNFFMDETFKSCSKQFYQLYSVHVNM